MSMSVSIEHKTTGHMADHAPLMPGPVVAQDLRQPDGFVPRSLPDLRAGPHAASYLDVPAAGGSGRRAVAWPPLDDNRARTPGMVVTALVRKSWPRRAAPRLLHSSFKHMLDSARRPASLLDAQLPGAVQSQPWPAQAVEHRATVAGCPMMSQDCRRHCDTISDNPLTIPADAPTAPAQDRSGERAGPPCPRPAPGLPATRSPILTMAAAGPQVVA